MKITVHRHASASLLPRKGEHVFGRRLVGLRAGLDAVVKRKSLALDRNRTAVFRPIAYLYTY